MDFNLNNYPNITSVTVLARNGDNNVPGGSYDNCYWDDLQFKPDDKADLSPKFVKYYYVNDHLGSIHQTLDEQGNIIVAQDYYPYGKVIPDRSYIIGYPQEKYKFTGKERDVETNLDYFGARYYNSKIGRWLSVDPMAMYYPGLSPYNYCVNNPINTLDPDGMNYYRLNGSKNDVKWFDGSGEQEGYTNIGSIYTYCLSDGKTYVSWCNNDQLLAVTIIDMIPDNWLPQVGKTGCKDACDAMIASTGHMVTWARINIANADDNGVVTSANSNAARGFAGINRMLDSGKPVEVGVDYKSIQVNNLKTDGGDGMTDHFVVIAGKTELIDNTKVSSTSFYFFDPRTKNKADGTSMNNKFTIGNDNLITGRFHDSVIKKNYDYTITTVRWVK